jgi:hypothetical protein
MPNVKAVQIGAGRLGLGLLGDIYSSLGFGVYLLNRRSNGKHYPLLQQQGEYEISFITGEVARKVPIAGFSFLPESKEDDGSAVALLADKQTSVCSIAVGRSSDHTAIVPVLCEAIRLRATEGSRTPLLVIAAENESNNGAVLAESVTKYAKESGISSLEAYVRDYVWVLNSIVDRTCTELIPDGSVKVRAEGFRSWHLDVSSLKPEQRGIVADMFRGCADVECVDDARAFALVERQKLWLTNAVHLAIAVLAYPVPPDGRQPIPLMRDAIRRTDIKDEVRAVQDELSRAFRLQAESDLGPDVNKYFSAEKVIRSNERVLVRVDSNPEDQTARIIRDLLGIEKATKFLVDIAKTDRGPIQVANLASTQTLLDWLDLFAFASKVTERLVEPLEVLYRKDRWTPQALPRLVARVWSVARVQYGVFDRALRAAERGGWRLLLVRSS